MRRLVVEEDCDMYAVSYYHNLNAYHSWYSETLGSKEVTFDCKENKNSKSKTQKVF